MKRTLSLCLVLLVCLSLCGCTSADYTRARQLKDEGSYIQAAAAFEALGDYKDSPDEVLDCRYLAADAAERTKDYTAAAALFEDLGSFRDSARRAARVQGFLNSGDLPGDRFYVQDGTPGFLAGAEAAMAEYPGLWEYCDYGSYELTYRLSLYEDGSFTFCLDREALTELADRIIGDTRAAVTDYLAGTVTKAYAGQGIALEDVYRDLGVEDMDGLLRWLNYDPAAMTERIIPRANFETAASASVINGTYTSDADSLTLTVKSSSTVQTYAVDGDTLILYGPEDPSSDLLHMADSYPMVFHR